MDDKKNRTLYCGNLSEKVTEELLYELFLQAGPLESVKIPKDKNGRNRNYSFITFKHDVSVPYTVALMQGISLFGREIRLELRTGAESERNSYLDAMNAHKLSNSSQNNSLLGEYCSPDLARRDSFVGYPGYSDARGDKVHALNGRYTSTPVSARYYPLPLTPLSATFNGYGIGLSQSLPINYVDYPSPLLFPTMRDKIQHLHNSAEMLRTSPYTPVRYLPSRDNKSSFQTNWRESNRRHH